MKKQEPLAHHHDPLQFPAQFLWGAATSAHQVEGGNTKSDWWLWERKVFRHKKSNQSGRAAGHYTRFRKDFELAKQLGHNAHRLSIEWARVEPIQGVWDQKEINHYRQVLTSLKKLNMTTMVTLHHFTNPLWFAKQGGWLKRKSAKQFSRYALKMDQELGDLVDFWLTINEPIIYVVNCYVNGTWPPQKRSLLSARRVLINMVRAHRLSWRKIQKARRKQEKNKANIGIAQNIVDFHTYYINHFVDYSIMRFLHWAINRKFLNKIKRQMNFIGVNYYFHIRIKRGKYGIFSLETIDTRTENREASDMNWEVNPQGIFEALLTVRRYNVPIYVTENGIATTNDHKRIRFLIAHLKEVYHAIKTGVDVRGYFFWSLIDNFEWDKGFWPRFGLLSVDYKTLKRTPNPSAFVYKKICEENSIAHELLRFLGHGIRWQPKNGDYEPR